MPSRRFLVLAACGAILLCVAWSVLAAESLPDQVAKATVAGAEVLIVELDPAAWKGSIVRAGAVDAFMASGDRVLVNGGYFDAAGQPDALVVDRGEAWGSLRDGSPYSGFASGGDGAVSIAPGGSRPEKAEWAIQSGPLLVEPGGKAGINRSTSVAPRTVLGLRRGRLLLVHSGRIGLRELAEHLVAQGVEVAINLDGGPSSALRVRIGGREVRRVAAAEATIPYFLGFAPVQGTP